MKTLGIFDLNLAGATHSADLPRAASKKGFVPGCALIPRCTSTTAPDPENLFFVVVHLVQQHYWCIVPAGIGPVICNYTHFSTLTLIN